MSQATNPHPQLVQCRNILQAAMKSRLDAANAAGELTHEQVDSVLASKSPDEAKAIVDAVRAKAEAEAKAAEKAAHDELAKAAKAEADRFAKQQSKKK